MTIVLREGQEMEVDGAAGAELWLHKDKVESASGWQLKPEGFCQD